MNDRQPAFFANINKIDTAEKRTTKHRFRIIKMSHFLSTSRTIGFLAIFLGTFALGWIAGARAYRLNHQGTGSSALDTIQIVDRIITIESGGDPNKKNKLSTATGVAQFLDQTWLEITATYRPDLAHGRNQS